MLNVPKLPLVLLIQALLVSPAFASEQSDSKGLVDDASASVLLRTGFIQRDNKNGAPDTNSAVQSVMLNAETGFTQGTVGFATGAVGDFSFKLGDNKHSGNQMTALKNNGAKDANGYVDPYDQWTRGGAYVKARVSNTTLTYGTQVLDIPVLASNTGRMVPEYFTGTLLTSHEVKDLEVIAGKFTQNQMSNQISTDKDASGNGLKRAYVWGAKYKFNDQFNASYYGLDSKDKLDRHYADLNYKLPLAEQNSLTFDLSGYATKFKAGAESYSGTLTEDTNNYIWAFSTTYNQGPHSVMLAYQQNTGGMGYDYGANADGFQSIYLPNSYLSDFNGRDEKSAQVQYNVDLGAFGVPGLSWTTAYVYGWNIDSGVEDNAKEHEFFNQVKYTVQSGFAKGTNLRVRNSILRGSESYLPGTNEWRIFLDIPVKFF
ncbi:OprD family outer membrane porin [Acinetobacter sp. MD2]|uniref:OprD family outer membrane porin n=1 Tax=Acinetobacter sp. MD2 TaxID=2600066 RepID=UPI002D1EF91F|nr:OprD family outer membrane porin [Acinetobacter sp. MD2]MEB3766917.1 outer membrane porin, OprD family [Acinetobacter sp. MD2]